ncbi:MAG: hypothetical protein AB7K37_04665 [Cyclobacteriaceae bacterium]
MELRDLIVTPIIIALVYTGAYLIRPYVTDQITRRYFMPALTVRIIGALALGFIYQFYYDGGDTFNYHTHGSRVIWEAMMASPIQGLKLFWMEPGDYSGVYAYASKILFISDPDSYFVIKLAAILDLFTFSSYAATATLFALLSFVGAWMMYLVFYRRFDSMHFPFAVAILFIPSVVFWGSGLLKDSVVLSCLGILLYSLDQMQQRRFSIGAILLLVISAWIIFSVKKYVLMCFLPASLIWLFGSYLITSRSFTFRILAVPLFFLLTVGFGYWSVLKIGEADPQYRLDNLARTVKITAYDIGFYTGRDAGSRYSLGSLDGSFPSMVRLFPQAVNVSLFRPYLWEVNNVLMLLTALESLAMLSLTILILTKVRSNIFRILSNPLLLFTVAFSLTFAFAVGVSSYNFGTLARYKIPLLPFYGITLVLIHYSYKENRDRKLALLEDTENS